MTNTPDAMKPAPLQAPHGLRDTLAALFSVDLRSLALLRIGLGVAILLDLAQRALDLGLLYTDSGVLPRDLVFEMQGRGAMFSIHYWASEQTWQQGLVFAVNAACAVALLLGWRTWLATLACWYFASSLQIRQPLVYMGGDSVLRLLLFWSLFLPLHARFAMDAMRRPIALNANRFLSGATIALLLQVCLMYWATGIAKDGDLWRTGQAVFYALHSDMATPFGVWLRDAPPRLLDFFTAGTLALERFGPFLAFVPISQPVFRLLTIVLFWGFHLGLAATMNIGLFPVFSMVAWLAFIPTEAWDRFRPALTFAYMPLRGAVARLASVLALMAIVYIVVSLAERTRVIQSVIPELIDRVGWALRLQQTWEMFAPDPHSRATASYIVLANRDGTRTTVQAATRFRPKLYLGYLQSLAPVERAPSARRFTRRWCAGENGHPVDTNGVERVTLLVEVREIQANGYQPPTTNVLANESCVAR